MRRTLTLGIAGLTVATTLTGCGGGDSNTALPDTSLTASVLRAYAESGTFAVYDEGEPAVTYDAGLVPVGSTAQVSVSPAIEETTVQLEVNGLLPEHRYGAHLHTNVCGAKGEDAGPHYQHAHDPKAEASPPSVDPSYANNRNEIWLDFTTDVIGSASVDTTVPFRFDARKPPRSLVIHAEHTKTNPGRAGSAGTRLACLTLPE